VSLPVSPVRTANFNLTNGGTYYRSVSNFELLRSVELRRRFNKIRNGSARIKRDFARRVRNSINSMDFTQIITQLLDAHNNPDDPFDEDDPEYTNRQNALDILQEWREMVIADIQNTGEDLDEEEEETEEDKKLNLVISTIEHIEYDIYLYDAKLQKLNTKIEEVDREIVEFHNNHIHYLDEIAIFAGQFNDPTRKSWEESNSETKNEIMEQMNELIENDSKNNVYLHESLDKYAILIEIKKKLIEYLQFLTIQKDILENTGYDELEPNIERIHNEFIERSKYIESLLLLSATKYNI
jgi:hypothetical protein